MSCDFVVVPGESTEHGIPVALFCSCSKIVPISWGENMSGFAMCGCGNGYGFKSDYCKFVRVR